jgi:hypothetical protein
MLLGIADNWRSCESMLFAIHRPAPLGGLWQIAALPAALAAGQFADPASGEKWHQAASQM